MFRDVRCIFANGHAHARLRPTENDGGRKGVLCSYFCSKIICSLFKKGTVPKRALSSALDFGHQAKMFTRKFCLSVPTYKNLKPLFLWRGKEDDSIYLFWYRQWKKYLTYLWSHCTTVKLSWKTVHKNRKKSCHYVLVLCIRNWLRYIITFSETR